MQREPHMENQSERKGQLIRLPKPGQRIIWYFAVVFMVAGWYVAMSSAHAYGLESMPAGTFIFVMIGLTAMAGATILCLLSGLDHRVPDQSDGLYLLLLLISYFGVFFEISKKMIDGLQHLILVNYVYSLITFMILALVQPAFYAYQKSLLPKGKGQLGLALVYVFMTLDVVFLLVGAATGFLFYIDADGYYHAGSGFPLTFVYPLCAIVFCLVENLRAVITLRQRVALLIFDLTPAVYFLWMLANHDDSFLYAILTFDLLIMYASIQMERSISAVKQEMIIAEQKRELTETHTQIMVSQIQPHFIYNTLGTISALCEEDPIKARDVTDEFARYLRVNMTMIGSHRTVPFSEELKHVQTYLAIEQVRFEGFLTVSYNVKTTDFELPPLSLQPLVENAVKHGVTVKETGGSVMISTWETDDAYVICVTDDGVGFDPTSPPSEQDKRKHLGIENVRARLVMLCGGMLNIDSRIDEGTTATIRIPKRRYET